MAWPTDFPAPLLTGYEIEAGDNVVRTDMETGPARVRRRSTSTPDNYALAFQLTEAQMNVFRAFWGGEWQHGAAWVAIPLRDGFSSALTPRECRPTQKWKAALVKPQVWRVQIPVEVRHA